MEWLKKLLGEENYNKLTPETLSLLTTALGSTEYVANDPLRIVPKHVFNEKNEENKLLKAQIEQYKAQLKDVGGMITDIELKTKLTEQELTFKNSIKEMENNYKKEIDNERKKFLMTTYLSNNNAKHSDLLLKVINLDDVIIKDDKILNADQIVLPLKEQYQALFDTNLKPGVLQNGKPTPPVTDKQTLINKYNEVEKSGDFVSMEKIRQQIKALEQG